MNTAKILYQQYKALPKGLQKELKTLINQEDDETVEVNLKGLKKGLREVKLIREGKLKARSAEEFLEELRAKKNQG